jgi:hypothetical protein
VPEGNLIFIIPISPKAIDSIFLYSASTIGAMYFKRRPVCFIDRRKVEVKSVSHLFVFDISNSLFFL